MMMMKLSIFTIIAIKALIFVTAAVLTVACFATKMMNNLDVDDGDGATTPGYGTTTANSNNTTGNYWVRQDGVVRGNMTCIYVTSVLPNCGKTWKSPPPPKNKNKKFKIHGRCIYATGLLPSS